MIGTWKPSDPRPQALPATADIREMEALFSWLAAGFGALFVIAVAVAWWEHLARSARPPRPPEPAPARAVSVDVRLDTQAGALYMSEAAERRAKLDNTMERIGRVGRAARDGGGAPDSRSPEAWPQTSPMVLHPLPSDETQSAGSPTSRA